jgi:mRNA interferase MazF
LPARGELWWCELADIGRRPVVVLSRDAAIARLRRTLIGPCTTTIRGLASEVVLQPGDDPVPERCAPHRVMAGQCPRECSAYNDREIN